MKFLRLIVAYSVGAVALVLSIITLWLAAISAWMSDE